MSALVHAVCQKRSSVAFACSTGRTSLHSFEAVPQSLFPNLFRNEPTMHASKRRSLLVPAKHYATEAFDRNGLEHNRAIPRFAGVIVCATPETIATKQLTETAPQKSPSAFIATEASLVLNMSGVSSSK